MTAEAASLHEALAENLGKYDSRLAAQLASADSLSAKDYLRSLRLRSVVQQGFDRVMAGVDVLIAPTTPTVAPRLGEWILDTPIGKMSWPDIAASNTFPFNVSGMPAVTVPIPTDGLPCGLQIAALPYQDQLVLSVAQAFERAVGGRECIARST